MDRLHQTNSVFFNIRSFPFRMWNRLRRAIFRTRSTAAPTPAPKPTPKHANREQRHAKVESLVWARWEMDPYHCFGFFIIRELHKSKRPLRFKDICFRARLEGQPISHELKRFLSKLILIGMAQCLIEQTKKGDFRLSVRMKKFMADNQVTAHNIALVKDYFDSRRYGYHMDRLQKNKTKKSTGLNPEGKSNEKSDCNPNECTLDQNLEVLPAEPSFNSDSELDSELELEGDNEKDQQKNVEEFVLDHQNIDLYEEHLVENANASSSNESFKLCDGDQENRIMIPCDSEEEDDAVSSVNIGDDHQQTLALEENGHDKKANMNQIKNTILNLVSLPLWIWNRMCGAIFRATPTLTSTPVNREWVHKKVEALVWCHWEIDIVDFLGYIIIREMHERKHSLSIEDMCRLTTVENQPNLHSYTRLLANLLVFGIEKYYIQQTEDRKFMLTPLMQKFMAENQVTALNIALVKEYFDNKIYGYKIDRLQKQKIKNDKYTDLNLCVDEESDEESDEVSDWDPTECDPKECNLDQFLEAMAANQPDLDIDEDDFFDSDTDSDVEDSDVEEESEDVQQNNDVDIDIGQNKHLVENPNASGNDDSLALCVGDQSNNFICDKDGEIDASNSTDYNFTASSNAIVNC